MESEIEKETELIDAQNFVKIYGYLMYGGFSIIPIFFSLSIIVGYIKLKAARFHTFFSLNFSKVNTFLIVSLKSNSNSSN